MSASSAVARMLTMVPWLLERPGASVAEAAEAFGVPPRTVRQDLAHLDFCGLPGLGGGALFDVTLVEDRVVVAMAPELRRPLRLTPREALRLVLSLQAVDEAFGDELPALRSAIEKVRRAANLPANAAVAVGEQAPGSWLADLRGALRAGRRVRLRYQGRGDDAPRDRLVEPWQLDVTPHGWYVHAHDVDAAGHRVFRLDRVADVEVLDEDATAPRPADALPQPRYEPSEDALDVVVRLGRSARWLADAVDADAVEEVDGGVEVRFRTETPAWVVRLLLMGAPDVRVVSPPSLAASLRAEAEAAAERHRSGN